MTNTSKITDHPATADITLLRDLVAKLLGADRVRLDRLWAYYRNPLRISPVAETAVSDRPYRQAQEWGLPARVTGAIAGENVFEQFEVPDVARKEVVIENDIGWRVDTTIDFLFGRTIVINSGCADKSKRDQIEKIINAMFVANGDLVFLQQVALLAAVYGTVDVLVKLLPKNKQISIVQPHAESASVLTSPDSASPASPEAAADVFPNPGASHPSPSDLERLARMIRFEIVEPARALPLLDPIDCRHALAFATVYQLERKQSPAVSKRPWLKRWIANKPLDPKRVTIVELITPTNWQRYEDETLVAEGANSLGRLPLVHIQNTPDPLSFCGASDVEPLIPVQDELNTRLSDRAHRVAMTSLRMYLGKGIENFNDLPIAPGRMWSTDNADADIIELGGDGTAPGEDAHISDVRESMDKLSGISPVAAGAIKGRIGQLTSAAALRVTLMALLSRTERKRTIYNLAIQQMCELALAWLDQAGLFKTDPEERLVTINWANPIPVNEIERLEEARAKQTIGIPRDVVLRELGYPPEA